MKFFGVFHIVKEDEHLAQLIDCVGRNPFRIVVFVEALQSFVREAANLHTIP